MTSIPSTLSHSSFLSPLIRAKPTFPHTRRTHTHHQNLLKFRSSSQSRSLVAPASSNSSFSWDDVFRVVSQPNNNTHINDSSKLHGFFEKIKTCNRGSEMQSEFLPFVIEQQIAGYVHNQFANHLRKFQHVFAFPEGNLIGSHANGGGGGYVTLHQSLKSPEDRTSAVADVIKCLGEGVIPAFFSLERAAAPYFGIKAYGIHLIGYVDKDGEKFLWIGKRSEVKPTFPGLLDHLAAGGL